jgi:CheY-like chemotaxis protein
MARILVVDDEAKYRSYLRSLLEGHGHEVKVAATGREAVGLGSRYRPAILIVDWMLRDQIHGIHVSRLLQEVVPEMRSILITAFPSEELKWSGRREGISCFVDKPFDAMEMRQAILEVTSEEQPPRCSSLGVIELNSEARILYANPRAQEMFAETDPGDEAICFTEFFEPGCVPDLDLASEKWIISTPRPSATRVWCIRSQPVRDQASRLVVLHSSDQAVDRAQAEMLLGVEDPRPGCGPLEGRVLVVDPNLFFHQVTAGVLENAGVASHAVDGAENALRMLGSDPEIRVAVVDHDLREGDSGALVREVQTRFPQVCLVGQSSGEHLGAFEALGVHRFLRKPWIARDLIRLVQQGD